MDTHYLASQSFHKSGQLLKQTGSMEYPQDDDLLAGNTEIYQFLLCLCFVSEQCD